MARVGSQDDDAPLLVPAPHADGRGSAGAGRGPAVDATGRDERRRVSNRWALAVLLVFAVLVAAATGYLLLSAPGGDESSAATADGAEPAPTAGPTPTAGAEPDDGDGEGGEDQDPPARPTISPVPTDEGGDQPVEGAAGGPLPFWTVVVASRPDDADGRRSAEQAGREVTSAGFEAVVLRSSAHTSLEPGFWVAAAGRHVDRVTASEAAQQVRAAGFDGAYTRCVGDVSVCR